MSRKVFISYNYNEDASVARNISTLLQTTGGPCYYTPRYVESETTRKEDIDRKIREVMQECDAVIFVVGDNTHNRPWINREAELAKSKGRGVVAVQAPGTTGGIPNELKDNEVELVEWKRDQVCAALDRLFA